MEDYAKLLVAYYAEKHPYICPNCGRPNYISNEFYNLDEVKTLSCNYCKYNGSKISFKAKKKEEIIPPYEWVIKISFNYSSSKNFTKAKSIAMILPNYIENELGIVCGTKNVIEYCKFHRYFNELSMLVHKWKNASIFYFDLQYSYSIDYDIFIEKVKLLSGDYKALLNTQEFDTINYENLPLPYVYYPPLYGAFFAFSEDVESEIYFCECEKEAITNYFEILNKALQDCRHSVDKKRIFSRFFPKYLQNYQINSISAFKFKPHLCFRCNKKIPMLNYCHQMYGGVFEQKHGWFIQQEYLINGLLPSRKDLWDLMPSKCASYIKPSVDIEVKMYSLNRDNEEYKSLAENLESVGSVYRLLNDKVRTDFGYRGIGEHWINETTLKHIIISLFPNKSVLAHYRPQWLNGLELDIYVPELKLAFEYQGIQHFQAIKHWGGKEKLIIQKEHDARKKRICDELGITLIYFDYLEDINTEYVKSKVIDFIE